METAALEKAHERLFPWRNQSMADQLKQELLNCSEITVYDLETSGLNPEKDRVIELAATRYQLTESELKEQDSLHQYIRPPEDVTLSEEIVELTGITLDILAEAPIEEECFEDVLSFFERTPVAGYNIRSFDNWFMRRFFFRVGARFLPKRELDVLEMARDFTPATEVPDFKLASVAKYYQIDAIRYHTAFSDTIVTAELLKTFMEFYQTRPVVYFKGTQRPDIINVSYWSKSDMERIYVNVEGLKIYYDIERRCWFTQSDQIDMAWLEKQVWKMVGAGNTEEFEAFRGKGKRKKQVMG